MHGDIAGHILYLVNLEYISVQHHQDNINPLETKGFNLCT